MFKKIMKHLTNNPSLKIISILIAVVLWLIVINIDNPKTTTTLRIPVTVVEEQVAEEMGKVYKLADESKYAKIQVSGPRKILDRLSPKDFTATADLNQIYDYTNSVDTLRVPIEISVNPPYGPNDFKWEQQTMNAKIYLENLSTEQTYVVADPTGTPAEGYALGELSVSPNLIKLSGPQSQVEQVKKIAAPVNVDGLTKDCKVSVTPVLYDENGRVIESSQIELSQNSVTVSVQILGTKTVPVRFETTGTPMDGYQFTGLEYAPDKITIKGAASVLNNVNVITIPGEAINLEGATGDVENSIDITPYLTEAGVSLVNEEENKIAVKALVERLQTKILEIPIADLEVLNAPENFETRYDSTTVRVTVRGRSEDLADLTAEQLAASVDLNELGQGTHMVPVSIVLDEKFQVMGEVILGVHIVKPGTEIPVPPEGGTGNGNGSEGGTGNGSGTGTDGGATGNGNGTATNPNG